MCVGGLTCHVDSPHSVLFASPGFGFVSVPPRMAEKDRDVH